ncbi:MAG: Response regulator receiver protein [Parcubacteria group bacterium GW2011_GWA2_44_15]|nr:MAG: Response regulator receiver protein [Parcubacteria group bacterium GW2011_GWA2_44_15]
MLESKKQKVLIIDDDQFLLNMYSIKFKKSGFDVDVANSGLDALAKLRDGAEPDVILLDVVMPAMGGFEFLENFRKEKLAPKARVVVLSNQNQPADVEQSKNLGVDSYIVKASCIPSEVIDEVIKIVGKA